MSRLTQIRLDAITGSLTAIETAAGSVTAGTPASGVASDLEGVLGHFAGAIKRITGGTSFTSQQQGHFNTDLTLSGANVFIDGNVSFDNDLLYLDQSNSRVGIGTSTPEATLTVSSQGTGNTRGITGLHYDNTTAFSQFKFIGGRARGSVGSPTAVQANDSLVSFNGRGRTDVGWSNTVGGLYVYAKENWTSTNTPTFITLRGVPTGGGTTVSEWVRVDNGTVISTNDLIASGTLKSLFSSGDEGGEVFLAKAATNTTLTTGVTIDINQNRLRVFETGGTNRGGYWDISSLGSGVSTNLASAAASPGGSNTYVQFNDGGTTFGGDAGLTYDKATDSLTVAGNITGSNSLFTGGTRVNGQLRVDTGIRNTGTVNYGFNNFGSNFSFTTQSFIGVDTALGAYTGTLPTIAGDYIGRVYSVKDVGGFCGTTPFVITASSPNKIDGATELKINTTSGSVMLIAGTNGASYNWYIMSYT